MFVSWDHILNKQYIFSVLLFVSFAVISACGTAPTEPSRPLDRITETPLVVIEETDMETGGESTVITTHVETPTQQEKVDKSEAETKPPDPPKIQIAAVPAPPKVEPVPDPLVEATCTKIAAKLASVGFSECMGIGLTATNGRSNTGIPILEKEYPPRPDFEPLGRVLLLAGTHGDELTSVSATFKWMRTLETHHTGKFHWVVAPLVNPDGVLRDHSIRGNENGVDLNRNFPTPFWDTRSRKYWLKTGHNPRRYPGPKAASEPETRWAVQRIESFKPDVIVSVHAPLELVDYDAADRSLSPSRIGILYRNLMGVYPGSLGNYAGVQRGIPVITLELPHSWIMPKPSIISHMWTDLVYWLDRHVPAVHAQRLAQKAAQ